MSSSWGLAVALSVAGCGATKSPPALVPYSDARSSLEIPEGWKTADEPDGSLRVDSPSGEIVLHVDLVPVGDARGDRATFPALGLSALGVEDVAEVPGAPAGVECARGARLGNVVVLCMRVDVKGDGGLPSVVFQGTPDAWRTVGADLVPRMTQAFSTSPSPR